MSLKTLMRTGAAAMGALVAALVASTTASAQTAIRVGTPVNGTLSASDRVMEVDGSNYDCYILSTRSGQSYTIDLTSNDFDTFIGMGSGRACQPPVEQTNDDISEDNVNSRLTFTSSGGDYFILANSYAEGETGAYRLIVSEGASEAAPAGERVALTRPTEPRARYEFDSVCAAMNTYVLATSDEADEDVFLEMAHQNAVLVENAKASGAALGIDEEAVMQQITGTLTNLVSSSDWQDEIQPGPISEACIAAIIG